MCFSFPKEYILSATMKHSKFLRSFCRKGLINFSFVISVPSVTRLKEGWTINCLFLYFPFRKHLYVSILESSLNPIAGCSCPIIIVFTSLGIFNSLSPWVIRILSIIIWFVVFMFLFFGRKK